MLYQSQMIGRVSRQLDAVPVAVAVASKSVSGSSPTEQKTTVVANSPGTPPLMLYVPATSVEKVTSPLSSVAPLRGVGPSMLNSRLLSCGLS